MQKKANKSLRQIVLIVVLHIGTVIICLYAVANIIYE